MKTVFYSLLVFALALFSLQPGNAQMQDATLSIDFRETDDGKVVAIHATDSVGNPIPDLELYIYVKRTFSLLPIGDFFNMTDEDGHLEIAFPSDLPGDEEGNIFFVVKIMESDDYNDLTIEASKKWGVPAIVEDDTEKRSLWAAGANAPIPLVLLISGMIVAIWGIIIYIIIVLFKIRRIPLLSNS